MGAPKQPKPFSQKRSTIKKNKKNMLRYGNRKATTQIRGGTRK